MAQITENTKTAVQGTLAGLLSALKSAGLSSGIDGESSGFSSLLSEVGSSLTANENLGSYSQDSRRSAVDTDKNVLQAQEDSDEPVATTQEEAAEETVSGDENNTETTVQQANAPSEDTDTAVEGSTQVASDDPVCAETESSDASTETTLVLDDCTITEDELQDMDEEELMALLATLVPLDLPVPLTGQAVQGLESVQQDGMATLDLTDETVQQALMQSLQRLRDLQEQISQTPINQTDSGEPSLSENLTELLADIADEISSMKDLIAQTVSQDQANAIEAVVGQDVAQAEETLTSILSSLTATTESSLTKTISTAGQSSLASKQEQENQAQSLIQDAALAAAAQGTASSSASGSSSSGTSGEGTSSSYAVQAASSASSQTLYAVASGSRTANSYDLANQLSSTNTQVTTNVSSTQVVEQVTVQLRKAVKEGVDEITIQLRPEELGKIEIKLEFSSDNVVKGTVVADNQSALSLLQNDAESLQKILQDAGLQADSGSLSFSLKDGGTQSQFAQDSSSTSSSSTETTESSTLEEAETALVETYYVTPGRVNIHV